jgi:hypothetical protein
MNRCHGPTCLAGPVTKCRSWWQTRSDEFSAVEPSLSRPVNGIRANLVERVRREIAAGTYETEDKLDLAFAKLFQSLDVD